MRQLMERNVNNSNGLLKVIAIFGWASILGVSMNANAGLFGFGGDSWKEEVLLHDGTKIIVDRSQSYGDPRHMGDAPPIKEQTITFTLPGTNKPITWKDETTEDIGHANFDLLALHIKNGIPYIVTSPNLCIAYNKWGNPTPPYIFFKYTSKTWRQIPISDFPTEFTNINLVIDDGAEAKNIASHGVVSSDAVKKLNGRLSQKEYKTIIRLPLSNGCPKLDPVKGGGWQSPGGAKAPHPIIPSDSDTEKRQ